jgi:hypothetical protein
MKRLLYASLIGCALTVLPLIVLWLPSHSGVVNCLKWVCTNLSLPGVYFGFVAAGGRIDDISSLVTDSANFLLYSALIYILLSAWDRRRAKA